MSPWQASCDDLCAAGWGDVASRADIPSDWQSRRPESPKVRRGPGGRAAYQVKLDKWKSILSESNVRHIKRRAAYLRAKSDNR